MKARSITLAPVVGLAIAAASCGSSERGSGFTGRETAGSSGAAGGSGGSTGSGNGGANTSGSNGGSGGFGTGDAALLSLGGDAASDAASLLCAPAGSTQSCCSGQGTQTCLSGEVSHWGPCIDAQGYLVGTCTPPPKCGPNEHGNGCDAGVDAPPPPPPPPPPPAACTDMNVNTEPGIFVGSSPAGGGTVSESGQIKVWVCDENSPFIAPGEVVNNTTGAVTTPGTRTATAADGYLYEPALYIAPASPTSGGTPHFPQLIKGSYNNNPPGRGTFTGGATIDTAPGNATCSGFFGLGVGYEAEFVWDVSSLGLAPGNYAVVLSIHDGDQERAIICFTITITA